MELYYYHQYYIVIINYAISIFLSNMLMVLVYNVHLIICKLSVKALILVHFSYRCVQIFDDHGIYGIYVVIFMIHLRYLSAKRI